MVCGSPALCNANAIITKSTRMDLHCNECGDAETVLLKCSCIDADIGLQPAVDLPIFVIPEELESFS